MAPRIEHTEHFTIALYPGVTSLTRTGYRTRDPRATITIGPRTYEAKFFRKPGDYSGRQGWIAQVTTNCTMECEGRTLMETAISMAKFVLGMHHGINLDPVDA